MKSNFLKITRRDFLKNTAELCFKIGLSSIFLYSCKPDASITKRTAPVEESPITETPTPVKKPSITKTPTPVKESGITGSDFEPAYLKLHKTGELESEQKNSGPLWKNASSVREDVVLIVLKEKADSVMLLVQHLLFQRFIRILAKKDHSLEMVVQGQSF